MLGKALILVGDMHLKALEVSEGKIRVEHQDGLVEEFTSLDTAGFDIKVDLLTLHKPDQSIFTANDITITSGMQQAFNWAPPPEEVFVDLVYPRGLK